MKNFVGWGEDQEFGPELKSLTSEVREGEPFTYRKQKEKNRNQGMKCLPTPAVLAFHSPCPTH